jgi:succinate dehydrogenase / fumarate reductase, cytochrome b subunit
MSTVASSPPARSVPIVESRPRWRWGSSIGLKILMAVTGIILSGFVLGHMAGNLQVFQGQQAIDDYAKFLRREPAILWMVRLVLLASVLLHIWAYLVLTRMNQNARPARYRETAHKETSFASASMRLTGPILAAFIIYHILHMTTGTVHATFQEGNVYHNLMDAFSSALVVVIYLLAMAMLALHLWHGVWSMFQTLGFSQPRHASFGRWFATIFTLVVVLGFSAVPLAVFAGLVR